MKLSTKGLNWQVSNDKRHGHVGEYGLCQLCTWTTVTYVKRAPAHLPNSEVLQMNPWTEDGEGLKTCGPINGCFCGYHLIHFHACTYKCLVLFHLAEQSSLCRIRGDGALHLQYLSILLLLCQWLSKVLQQSSHWTHTKRQEPCLYWHFSNYSISVVVALRKREVLIKMSCSHLNHCHWLYFSNCSTVEAAEMQLTGPLTKPSANTS